MTDTPAPEAASARPAEAVRIALIVGAILSRRSGLVGKIAGYTCEANGQRTPLMVDENVLQAVGAVTSQAVEHAPFGR